MRPSAKIRQIVLYFTILAVLMAGCSKNFGNCFRDGLTVGSQLKYQIGSNGNGRYYYTLSFAPGPEGKLTVDVHDGAYTHQFIVNSECRTTSGEQLPGPTGLPVWISPQQRLMGAFVWETKNGVDWRFQGPTTFRDRFALRIASDSGSSAFYDATGFFLGWEPQPNYHQLLVESNISGLKPLTP